MYFPWRILHLLWILHGLTSSADTSLLREKYISRTDVITSNKPYGKKFRSFNSRERIRRSLGSGGNLNKTESNTKENSKRQYSYGVPSIVPAFQPRRDLVSYPRVGIHRGILLFSSGHAFLNIFVLT